MKIASMVVSISAVMLVGIVVLILVLLLFIRFFSILFRNVEFAGLTTEVIAGVVGVIVIIVGLFSAFIAGMKIGIKAGNFFIEGIPEDVAGLIVMSPVTGLIARGFGDKSLGISESLLCGLVIGVGTTIITLLIVRILDKTVFFSMTFLLTFLKFRTILCSHCLRYTQPFKSRYENGRRYCEHCHEEIESTKDPGVVIFTFGNVSLAKPDGRAFIHADPNLDQQNQIVDGSTLYFKQKDRPIDVSNVYIDAKTCEPFLLEKFITYIVNYPPKNGVRAVRIFYQGELDELGENLKNALQNNFEHVEKID